MIDLKLILKSVFITIAIVFVVGYAIFEFRWFIQGPIISIKEPVDGESFDENPIKISGEAKNISHLTLNDWPISISNKGAFEEKFLLSPGYNVLKLESQDKFGRKKTLFWEVFYQL